MKTPVLVVVCAHRSPLRESQKKPTPKRMKGQEAPGVARGQYIMALELCTHKKQYPRQGESPPTSQGNQWNTLMDYRESNNTRSAAILAAPPGRSSCGQDPLHRDPAHLSDIWAPEKSFADSLLDDLACFGGIHPQ
jgi:hypothetical protein